MRYLGIDYGDKRIGVALSDPEGKMAFPEEVIQNLGADKTFRKLKGLIEREKVSKIIVGLPVSFDGSETEQARIVRKFAKSLEGAVGLQVEFANEVLTTRLVEKSGVPKGHADEAAAAVILQSYLDKLT